MRLRANAPDGAPAPLALGCLLGSQEGRVVDVANSFEAVAALGQDGTLDLDEAFLLKKQEQCA